MSVLLIDSNNILALRFNIVHIVGISSSTHLTVIDSLAFTLMLCGSARNLCCPQSIKIELPALIVTVDAIAVS